MASTSPVAVVRRFLEGVDPVEQLTGNLRRAAELDVLAEATVESVDVERLELMKGDDATAVVIAVVERTVAIGGRRFVESIRGPVQLAREPAGWKIVDYLRSGRSRLASLHLDLDAQAKAGPLVARVVLADLAATETTLVVELENTGAGPIGIGDATVGVPRGRGWRFLQAEIAREPVPAGEARRGEIVTQPLPVDEPGLRLQMTTDRGETIDLVVRLSGEELPEAKDTRPLRLRQLPLVAALIGGVGLIGFLAWTGSAFLALAVAAFLGLTWPVELWRGRRRGFRPSAAGYAIVGGWLAAWAAVGLVAVVVTREGGWLGCPSRDGPGTRRVADSYVVAVLRGDEEEAARHLIASAQGLAPTSAAFPIGEAEARAHARRGRRDDDGVACNALGFAVAFPGFPAAEDLDGPCFVYPPIETSGNTGPGVSEFFIGLECHDRRWVVTSFSG